MAALLSGEPSHHGAPEGNSRLSQEKPEEEGGQWYFSRKDLDENSPSRRDGIDLKKETYLRKSYCTFLQDLGMRLKVPQVTIATAIIFCHRFFLRQSHAKNDRRTIATVCMFLAGKVEETPRPLKDVILVSYEIINKKDPAASQRIKQKEVYEQQKELILVGERVVLGTLGFDLNVHHPYKPLVEAIKKFKVAQNALAQVAWNFVNDGLRTSLCLQFMPYHIAAGAIFLAAKFLKVKLPSDGEKVWWQEFDVTPRQLEEVSNQMLELYEQNRMPQSSTQVSNNEAAEGSSQRPSSKGGPAPDEHHTTHPSHGGGSTSSKPPAAPFLKPAPPSRPVPDQPHPDNHNGPLKTTQSRNSSDHDTVNEVTLRHEREHTPNQVNSEEMIQNKSKFGSDDQEGKSGRTETTRDSKNTVGQSPQNASATKKFDKEKLKAAFKQRKARGDITRKIDPMDEIERELEDIEVPPPTSETSKRGERRPSKQSSNRPENETSVDDDFDIVEEGEVESPRSSNSTRKRKSGSPLERPPQEGKQRLDHVPGSQKQNHHGYPDDRNGLAKIGYSERDHKRHLQENHV